VDSAESKIYWRRVAILLAVWTFTLSASLTVALVDDRHQGESIAQIKREAEARAGRPLDMPLDGYFTLLHQGSRDNAILHGLMWLMGTAAIIGIARRNRRATLEHATAEAAMREREFEFRTTMEATTVGIFRIKNLHFDYVNPAMARMFGYTQDEYVSGVSPMDIVVPEEREWVRQNTLKRASGELGHPYQVTCLRKDGSRFHGLVWSNRIFYRGTPSTVGSMLDISERIRAEEELRRAVDSLAASNMELERFAYVASHDLQEPLRSITSFTQLLNRRIGATLDEENRDYLNFIITGGKRMHALVNDLLAYSRVGSKGTPFTLIDSAAAIATALQNLHDSIEEAHAEIHVGALPTVMSDGMQLVQLFQNLIGNAIKFRASDTVPVIDVTAQTIGNEVMFSVSDNGIGIPAEHIDQIFTVFRRLHSTETYPGTGIGLAICKRIVERHGGRIWVESAPNQGSRFFFSLPLPNRDDEPVKLLDTARA
jgi:PAS domain S-box-containing protein